jgi:hypothetical protein
MKTLLFAAILLRPALVFPRYMHIVGMAILAVVLMPVWFVGECLWRYFKG